MRLIDADSLYDALGNKLTWLMGYGDDVYLTVGSDIRDTIDNQQTTYDVDKVVAELDKASYLVPPKNKGHYADNAIDLCDAIEIVKAGGVNGQS